MLAFGADAIPGADADVLEVDRAPWEGGGPTVPSLWLDDRARALELARAAPSFAFAAEPAIVVGATRLTMEPIVLPTPFPVGPVNCWLLRGDPLTLVDAGPNTPEALAALEAGLAGHGLRIEDVELLILTPPALRPRRARRHDPRPLRLPGRRARAARGLRRRRPGRADRRGGLGGAPAALPRHVAARHVEAFLAIARDRRRYGGAGATLDVRLADGDVVEAGGRRLRAALRPGHSPTDTLFVDDATGTALAGDHLIAHISSNPLVHRPPTRPGRSGQPVLVPRLPISTRSPAPSAEDLDRAPHGPRRRRSPTTGR